MVMPKRYTEYWINESCKCKTVFLSEKEIENYVRTHFPRDDIMMLTSQIILDCKGHTYRQIMGLDELDCGVKHEFLEHPHRYFIRELWWDFIDFFKREKN